MKRFLLLLIICFLSFTALAQYTTPEIITTGGDSYMQSFGKIEVTIGEAIIETYQGNGIYLTQGFQQGNLIVSAIEENSNDAALRIQVFPNPTINELNIISDNDGQILIQLFDSNGKLLFADNISKSTVMNFSDYAAGCYLLRLETGNSLKTFKIQKVK